MDRRQTELTFGGAFDQRIAWWRNRFIEIRHPKAESALLQIASDARRAENPMNFLNTHAQNLYDRLTGQIVDSDDESMDDADERQTTATTRSPAKAKKEKSEESDEEDSSHYSGLFAQSSLSERERAEILAKGDDSHVRKAIDTARREAQKSFNESNAEYGGKTFVFNTTSAKRHVEQYIKDYGFPEGTSTVEEVKTSLLKAASALVDKGTLGNKGYSTKAEYRVNPKFAWHLIIEPVKGKRNTYSIEHADINDIY